MKRKLLAIKQLILFNFKPLLIFEIAYRLLGILIVFPLAQALIFLAIRLSGYAYITNRLLIDFLTMPTTILVVLVLGLFLALYVVVEVLFLSYLFKQSSDHVQIDIYQLLYGGTKHTLSVLKSYHVLLIFPAIFLFLAVELFQFSALVSTINIPQIILDQIGTLPLIRTAIVSVMGLILIFALLSVYFIPLFSTEQYTIKDAFKTNRKFLKGSKGKMILDFLVINIVLNVALFLLYFVIVALVASFIFITRGQAHVLSFLLTVLYFIYLVIGFVASLILLPVNYALVEHWSNNQFKKHSLTRLTLAKSSHFKTRKKVPKKPLKYGVIITTVLLIIINITSIFSLVVQGRNPISIFNYPEIIAHRGASEDAPENTIASIEEAINQGADAVEIDIRRTADGIPVVIHDSTTGRTTNDTQSRLVSELTLEELQALDAGSFLGSEFAGERIPTLEEALEVIKGRIPVYIEPKIFTNDFSDDIIELINAFDMVDEVTILSFDRNQLEYFKATNEDFETTLLLGAFFGDFSRLINYDYIDHFAFESSIIINNPTYIERLHAIDKKVMVWTVNDRNRLAQVVELEVDGIITDRPLVAREVAYGRTNTSLYNQILRALFE